MFLWNLSFIWWVFIWVLQFIWANWPFQNISSLVKEFLIASFDVMNSNYSSQSPIWPYSWSFGFFWHFVVHFCSFQLFQCFSPDCIISDFFFLLVLFLYEYDTKIKSIYTFFDVNYRYFLSSAFLSSNDFFSSDNSCFFRSTACILFSYWAFFLRT